MHVYYIYIYTYVAFSLISELLQIQTHITSACFNKKQMEKVVTKHDPHYQPSNL